MHIEDNCKDTSEWFPLALPTQMPTLSQKPALNAKDKGTLVEETRYL